MPIHSEEEYHAQLGRIVNASIIIGNPLLLDQAKKDRYLAAYDQLVTECEEYRREELCMKFPGLREQYVILGWLPEKKLESTPEPEPIQKQPPIPKPFRDFLDDD